jgi:hypothetical protein
VRRLISHSASLISYNKVCKLSSHRERDCKKNWLLEGDSVSQVDENGRKLANTTYTFGKSTIMGSQRPVLSFACISGLKIKFRSEKLK